MFVLTLILLAASISQPIYQNMMLRAREAALRDTLYTLRSMIDRFTLDNRRPPESLGEMVEKGYLGDIPVDPFTHSQETWQVESEDFPMSGQEAAVVAHTSRRLRCVRMRLGVRLGVWLRTGQRLFPVRARL